MIAIGSPIVKFETMSTVHRPVIESAADGSAKRVQERCCDLMDLRFECP